MKRKTPERTASTKIKSIKSQGIVTTEIAELYVNNNIHKLREFTSLLGSRTSIHHIGDADTLFRKTLRNYNVLPDLRNLTWLKTLKKPDGVGKSEFPRDQEASKSSFPGNTLTAKEQGQLRVKSRKRRPLANVTYSENTSPPAVSKESTISINFEPEPQRAAGDPLANQKTVTKEPLEVLEEEAAFTEDDEGSEKASSTLIEEYELIQEKDSLTESELAAESETGVEYKLDRSKASKSEEGSTTLTSTTFDSTTESVTQLESAPNIMANDLQNIQQMVTDIEDEMNTGLAAGVQNLELDANGVPTIPEDDESPNEVELTVTGCLPNFLDAKILQDLEDVETQARIAADKISELKCRVGALLAKDCMTEDEARDLDDMNRQLVNYMETFEERTRQIQKLMVAADKTFSEVPRRYPEVQPRRTEDALPKVVVCGPGAGLPGIVVCEAITTHRKRRRPSPVPAPSHTHCANPDVCPPPPGPQFARRLSESYEMQEQLAADNVDLEGKRYQLQEELLSRDQVVEGLQRQVCGLRAEMRIVVKENSTLNDTLAKYQGQGQGGLPDVVAVSCRPPSTGCCGTGRGVCPADVESRLQHYSKTTSALEHQVEGMEEEVKRLSEELENMQRERGEMERERQMMAERNKAASEASCFESCRGPCSSRNAAAAAAQAEQQLREMREQYARLQDDYKGKITEVAGLRTEADALRKNARNSEDTRRSQEMQSCCSCTDRDAGMQYRSDSKQIGNREQGIEQDQQLAVARQRFRDAQEELEEVRALTHDQAAQLEDYRNRYLQAQQCVEEQRRRIDILELEQGRVAEQVQAEIQRAKAQFQERLAELLPLPDILKTTQLRLHEEQQLRQLAERAHESTVRELQTAHERAAQAQVQVQKALSMQQVGEGERSELQNAAAEWRCRCSEVQQEGERLRSEVDRLKDSLQDALKRADEKSHESAQLAGQLETVREESARQVARTKDRCNTVRRTMQMQMAELERQLAQSRAIANSAQRDCDEVREKTRAKINNLCESYEQAHLRMLNLQGQLNCIQTSQNMFPPSDMAPEGCDCGNN